MVEIVLLGRVSASVAGVPVTGEAAQRRRLALLTLLCNTGLRPVGRDRLMAYLWPENDTESARHLLSASLHVLRKTLGADAILTAGEEIALDPAHVRVDAIEFENAARAGDAERAVALYTGVFGEGLFITGAAEFEHWLDARREELARQYATMLEACADARARQGNAEGAIDAWRKLAALDPYSARTTLGLMRALAAAGNRAGALQAARVHTRLLEAEFGATPEPDVLRLANELRQESAAPTAAPATRQRAAEGMTSQQIPVPAASPEPEPEQTANSEHASAGHSAEVIAPLADSAPVSDMPTTSTAHSARPRPRGRVSRRRAALLFGLAAVLVLITTYMWPSVADRSSVRVIAVVPLRDAPGDTVTEFFSLGIAEEIHNELRRAAGLTLINQPTSVLFSDSTMDARRLGSELGAQAVLFVSARTSARELHVDLQLVRTSNGHELWGTREPVLRGELGSAARGLASLLCNALGLKLAPPNPAAATGGTTDEAAQELYMKARAKWSMRTPLALREALTLFQSAVERDSQYARAHAGLADTYNLLGSFEYGVLSPDSAYGEARLAAERALRITPDFAPAIAARANVLMNYGWKWQEAEQEFRRALDMDRSYTPAREWLALLLLARGEPAEARTQLQQALTDNGNSALALTDLAQYFYFRQQYDSAYVHIERALSREPAFSRAHALNVLVLCAHGRTAQAVQAAELLNRHAGEDPLIAALLGYVYARDGRSESAREQLILLDRLGQSRYVAPEVMAMIHIGLGDADRALALMETAANTHSSGMIYLTIEPMLDPLRTHPRFQRLLQRVHG